MLLKHDLFQISFLLKFKFKGLEGCVPRNSILDAEIEVQRNLNVGFTKQDLIIQRHESEIIHNVPLIDNIGTREWLHVIVHKVACYIEGITWGRIICEVSIFI